MGLVDALRTDPMKRYWSGRGAASAMEINRIESRFGMKLPEEFRRFLRWSNGGRWNTGDHFVNLWWTGEIARSNNFFDVQQRFPGVLGIGSDERTGNLCALDFRGDPRLPPVVQVPTEGSDAITVCGPDLETCFNMWCYQGLDRLFCARRSMNAVPTIIDLVRMIPSWHRNTGARPEQIARAESALGVNFPDAYKQLLAWSNGVDLVAGKEYLRILSVDELEEDNRKIRSCMPEAVAIGSDAGDLCYALDYRTHPPRIISSEYGDLDPDTAEVCGPSLEACLLNWSGIEQAALDGGRANLLRCFSVRVSKA